jgi:hypothetical protein
MPAILDPPRPAVAGLPAYRELVDEGSALDARMKRDALRMAEIKTVLVEKGPGEYWGSTSSGARALVIFPAPKIAPKPELIPDVEKAIGKPAFNALFERVILWKPVKSCRDVALRVLSGAKLKKFLDLAEADCPAQVRFS